jgi:hypothetical protein
VEKFRQLCGCLEDGAGQIVFQINSGDDGVDGDCHLIGRDQSQ